MCILIPFHLHLPLRELPSQRLYSFTPPALSLTLFCLKLFVSFDCVNDFYKQKFVKEAVVSFFLYWSWIYIQRLTIAVLWIHSDNIDPQEKKTIQRMQIKTTMCVRHADFHKLNEIDNKTYFQRDRQRCTANPWCKAPSADVGGPLLM